MGRTPEPGAHVTTTPLPDNPWEKWGWAFAAIWLVFLAFPVIAVVESDVGIPAKVGALLCIAGFAVANVLGYSSRLSPWWALGVMLVLALATVPVIGIGVISFTPYLAILSALELPSPAWKWAVGVWAAFPLLSLLDIDGFPTFFFLMLWPVMIGGVMLRLFGEREYVANAALREHAVVIELGPHGITVTDDGDGCTGAEGNGLRGMRERVTDAGGTLVVGDAGPGTRVEVRLP